MSFSSVDLDQALVKMFATYAHAFVVYTSFWFGTTVEPCVGWKRWWQYLKAVAVTICVALVFAAISSSGTECDDDVAGSSGCTTEAQYDAWSPEAGEVAFGWFLMIAPAALYGVWQANKGAKQRQHYASVSASGVGS